VCPPYGLNAVSESTPYLFSSHLFSKVRTPGYITGGAGYLWSAGEKSTISYTRAARTEI
jgi:hypothetical protein